MRELVKCNFWCNAGYTEEIVEIEIFKGEDKDEKIKSEFIKWLDNNEQSGWEEI